MTTADPLATGYLAVPLPGSRTARLGWVLRDAWTLTRREFAQLRHQPGELVGSLVFPALLVVMFGYVFGSAISIPGGGNYREYLMPGLFALTAVTSVMVNALLISKDVALGVMDRFRSMPMSRLAVPLSRALLDLITCALSLTIMAGIGLIVGWRAHLGVAHTAAAFTLILLLRFALTWVGIAIGMSVEPETADAFVPLFLPVSMLSNGFVPTAGQPGWLRPITEWNPVSALVQSCRQLFGNPGANAPSDVFPLAHPYLWTIVSALILIAIFAPITMRRFAHSGD
jgi:ABC-2 type transport system permease protein